MMNLSTKFEVCMFTHYDKMKGNAKLRNWGDLGVRDQSGSHKITDNATIR